MPEEIQPEWMIELQKISKEVDQLRDHVNSSQNSMRTNKILFFREEFYQLRQQIIRLIENNVHHRPLMSELLPKLKKLAVEITHIEESLPQHHPYVPYKMTELDPQTVVNSLSMFDTDSIHGIGFKGSKDDWLYLEQFPIKDYQLLRNGYRLLFIDAIEDYLKNLVRQSKEWEPEITHLLRKHILPGSTVIDAGAHIGLHTLSMSLFAGDQGKVIAFEPQLKIYRELIMNLKINECQNVKAYRCALGDSAGTTELEAVPHNEGGTSIGTGGDKVFVIPLDLLHIDNVSLIKIDVENFEYQVLTGAYQTISKYRPVIILEIMAKLTPERVEKMIDILNLLLFDLGYSMQFINWSNYIAIPYYSRSATNSFSEP